MFITQVPDDGSLEEGVVVLVPDAQGELTEFVVIGIISRSPGCAECKLNTLPR